MMRRMRSNSRGFALPAVMLFLVFAFGAWAVFFRSSGSIIRVEQARVLRESRSQWTAPAGAVALRLLQTGNPPSDPYSCKVTLTQDAETRYLRLTFEKIGPSRWSFTAVPTDADETAPDAPPTFFTVPEPPGGMDATPISTTRIDVSWADVPFDNGYLIERSANGTSGWTQIGTTAKNVTTYSSTGLVYNTTYYYRVRGTNSAGDGSYSAVVSAKTLNVIPGDPSNLIASAVSTSQINLTWADNSNNESGFLVERSPNGSSGWSQIALVAQDTISYSNTGLTNATTYYYRVRATNAIGNSGYSNMASTTTLTTPPAAPTALAAVASTSSQIDLTWTDNASNETGFKIERSPNGTTGWTQIATPAANAVSYSDTGLTEQTAYYYRIRATNAGGDSANSNTANATTPQAAPGVPSLLVATASSSTQIDLTWTDNATTETGFKIERSLDNVTWAQITTVGVNASSFSNSGLSANTTYYYRVRAYNGGGNSAFSNTSNTATLPTAPSAPTAFNATAASSSQITMTWTDNSSNETGFKVERSPDNVTWAQIGTTVAGVASYSDSGLAAATKYYYRVRAYNAGGNSAYSATDNATTTSTPAIPTGLSATVMSTTSVRLNWTDNSNNETGFRVQRSTNNSTWTTVTTTAANATTYTVTGLTHNQLYYFRIRANGSVSNSGNTASVTATP